MNDAEPPRRPGVTERSVDNLSAVLRDLLPGGTPRPLYTAPADALVALILLLLTEVLVYAVTVSPQAITFWEMRGFTGAVVFHLLAVVLVVIAKRRTRDIPEIVVGLLWAMIAGLCLAFLVGLAFPPVDPFAWVLGYAFPSILPAGLFLLARLGPIAGAAAALALVMSVGAITLEWAGVSVWGSDPEETAQFPPEPDTEAVYAAQAGLLSGQTRALRPSTPGHPELFAVLGAGFPYEDVFRREVDAVASLLGDKFDAEGRVIRLVNSADALMDYPLLNRTNLTAALAAVTAAMDDEDILFLFLTSHGAPGFISTDFAGVTSRNLEAADVARALDAADAGNAVVIVSACYSGSFVDALTAPRRLVLTASREERNSFGCSNEADWTDWGRAFFVDALSLDPDPRVAARIARDLVSRREVDEGYDASLPQIAEGAAIGAALDRWLAALPDT